MENNIQVFSNEEFGDVRTVTTDGDPWFVAKDVAEALGYRDTKQAIRVNVADEDKKHLSKREFGGCTSTTSEINNNGAMVINESGLYALIFGSKLESAKKFKSWVTSEVLPSIRKHGIYATDNVIDNVLNNPDFGIKLLTKLKEERAEKERLALENKEMKPKVEYHDNVLNKSDLITTTVIAKDLGLSSAAKLNQVMYANRIIYKGPFGSWCPFAEYEWLIKEGYADYKSYAKENAKLCLKWTEKGRKWIINNYNEWVRNLLKD